MNGIDISVTMELPDGSKFELAGFKDYRQGTPQLRKSFTRAAPSVAIPATKEQIQDIVVLGESAAQAKWPGLRREEVVITRDRGYDSGKVRAQTALKWMYTPPAREEVSISRAYATNPYRPTREAGGYGPKPKFSGSSLGLRAFLRSAKGRMMSHEGMLGVVAELNKNAKAVFDSMARSLLPPGGAFNDYLDGVSIHPSRNGIRFDIDGWDANARELGWKPTPGGMEQGLGKYDGQRVDLRTVMPATGGGPKRIPLRLEGTEGEITSLIAGHFERGRLRVKDLHSAMTRANEKAYGKSKDTAFRAIADAVIRDVKTSSDAAKVLVGATRIGQLAQQNEKREAGREQASAKLFPGVNRGYKAQFSRARKDLRAWSTSPLAGAVPYTPRASSPKGTVGLISFRMMDYDQAVAPTKGPSPKRPKPPRVSDFFGARPGSHGPLTKPQSSRYAREVKKYERELTRHKTTLRTREMSKIRAQANAQARKNKWTTAGIKGIWLLHAISDAYQQALEAVAKGDTRATNEFYFRDLVEAYLDKNGSLPGGNTQQKRKRR